MVKEIIQMIESEINKGEQELKRIEFMISVLSNAGEDTTSLKTKAIEARTRLNQLKKALSDAKMGLA